MRQKRTQLDDVALELGLELDRINVLGVLATVDVDGDLGSPQSTWPMFRRAISHHFIVEGLQYADILLHFDQPLSRLAFTAASSSSSSCGSSFFGFASNSTNPLTKRSVSVP